MNSTTNLFPLRVWCFLLFQQTVHAVAPNRHQKKVNRHRTFHRSWRRILPHYRNRRSCDPADLHSNKNKRIPCKLQYKHTCYNRKCQKKCRGKTNENVFISVIQR